MTTKFYDVSDLVVETQDKPYRGNALPTVDTGEPAAPCTYGGIGGYGHDRA